MTNSSQRDNNRPELSRRTLLQAGAAGGLALAASSLAAEPPKAGATSADAAAVERTFKLRNVNYRFTVPNYLTPPDQFREFEREKPRVDQMPPEKLREVGLDRDTWRLEVVPDPQSNCKVERPLSEKSGSALTWAGLLKLAEKHAVRFLHVLTCTNMPDPMGIGLWEGVPLREIFWLARPTGNVRRVCYWGYHHGDPKQRFQSSLPVGRVLEDPPGELPVILCYKLNGQPLSIKAGGPVRLIVPGVYGNKSVKWLQSVVLTNSYQANDTYALWNNDVETAMKTQARFLHTPASVKAGKPLPLVGLAQVGMSGLSKVQYCIEPDGGRRKGDRSNLPERPEGGSAQIGPVPFSDPADDPYFTKADWRDAAILPPPDDWGGGLPDGRLPPIPLQFDPATGKPRSWPLPYMIAHWAALLPDLRPGSYRLRCRTIDAHGIAQPMPRPFPKSGNNAIHEVRLTVEA